MSAEHTALKSPCMNNPSSLCKLLLMGCLIFLSGILLQVIEHLLSKGSDIEHEDVAGCTPLSKCCAWSVVLEKVKRPTYMYMDFFLIVGIMEL